MSEPAMLSMALVIGEGEEHLLPQNTLYSATMLFVVDSENRTFRVAKSRLCYLDKEKVRPLADIWKYLIE